MEVDRPLHDRPVAYVIAQEYSSAIFVSLRFHSRKEKFDRFKRNLFIFVSLKNVVCLKLS